MLCEGNVFIENETKGENFEGVLFENCRFNNTNLRFTTFNNCSFENCDLSGTLMDITGLSNCKFHNSKLRGVDLSPAQLKNFDFSEAILRDYIFQQPSGRSFHPKTVNGCIGKLSKRFPDRVKGAFPEILFQ